MMSCWQDNPADRSSFDELEETLSEMFLNCHADTVMLDEREAR